MRIGFVGGGTVGHNLAALFAAAGYDVAVGLRDPGRAKPGAPYRTLALADAARHGEAVILALHFKAVPSALPPLADALAGRIVVDATNPLNDDWSAMPLPTSAGETVATLLPRSPVVKAFNTIFADTMRPDRLDRGGRRIAAFVAGDHAAANAAVASLARDAGFEPVIAGGLRLSRYLEAMAHLNIAVALGGGGTDAAFLYDRRRS